jgi:hypothetical protein
MRMSESVRHLFGKVVLGDLANETYQGKTLGNLTPGSSAEHLQQLVNKWFLGMDHPELLDAAQHYDYASGQLFGTTLGAGQVRYGYQNIVDGGLLCAMATVAQWSPATIRNLFLDNGDGTFTVKLFQEDQPMYVTVDRYLPVDSSGKLVYAQVGAQAASPSTILWPALLEKAVAQAAVSGWLPQLNDNTANSYRSIHARAGNALWSGQALGILTGRGFTVGDQITRDTLPEMLALLQAKEFVTVSSNCPPNYGLLPNPAIARCRYYTILSYNPANGGTFKLQLSFGNATSYTDTDGRVVAGVVTLTTAQFLANMQFYSATTSFQG